MKHMNIDEFFPQTTLTLKPNWFHLIAPLFKRCHMFLTPDPVPDTTLQGFVPLLGIFYLLGKFVNHYTMELPNMHIYVY